MKWISGKAYGVSFSFCSRLYLVNTFMAYKHLFFDLDQTIAPTRQPILPEMYSLLTSLEQDIIVVTGQGTSTALWQANNLPAIYLSQCGNAAYNLEGEEMWMNDLSAEQKLAIHSHIDELRSYHDQSENPEWHPIEDRGALVCYSPIGNRAPVDIKKVFDPDSTKREAMLKAVPFTHHQEVAVCIGGSTSFDYTHAKHDKGTNVRRLIDLMSWNQAECVYFGDRLHPGGNDAPVIGVIDTIAVKDHLDTFAKLKEMFGK